MKAFGKNIAVYYKINFRNVFFIYFILLNAYSILSDVQRGICVNK